MQKYLSKILILTVMMAIFVVPVSLNIKINDKHLAVNIKTNIARAEDLTDCLSSSTFKVETTDDTVQFDYQVSLNTGYKTPAQRIECYSYIQGYDTLVSGTLGEDGRKEGLFLFYYETGTDKIINFSFDDLGIFFDPSNTENPSSDAIGYKTSPKRFNFKPDTEYTAGLAVIEECWSPLSIKSDGTLSGESLFNTCIVDSDNNSIIKTATFKTSKNFVHKDVAYQEYVESQTPGGTVESDFGCSLFAPTKLGGCILAGLDYVWQATALIANLGGYFLDFFVYYATNSSSYSNIFVEKAWSAVRDVANIFFIVALLYVAIKTILSLNVTDNKKLIGYVVVIALIINFSLFTTKVVIDGSNILAKIFYNNIVSKDASATNENGTLKDSEAGTEGQKSISAGLIRLFDPQDIVMKAYTNTNLGLGYAIFIIILLIAIMLYTTYIFFSVGILFVARVVSLWMSMIFSPLAFASYTVPFDIPGFGHKEWWDDLLKNAFLAPLFTFMLYIIVMFAGFLKDIVKYTDDPSMTTTENGMQHLMSIIIPFFILMMLLTKAKTLVEKYSGEMGKAVMKGAQMIGGVALGAATGGAAILGSGAIGNLASRAASSKGLQDAAKETGFKGAIAKMALRSADYGSKASFDLRKAPGAGAMAKLSGMNLESVKAIGLGSKEGGYTQRRKEQVEKKQKRAKELEVREDEPLKQALNKTEMDLQGLLSENAQVIETLDKDIEKKREEVNDAEKKFNAAKGTRGEAAARANLTSANGYLDLAKQNKTDFRNGNDYMLTNSAGVTSVETGTGVNINTLEGQKKTQVQAIKTENVKRRQAYAKGIIKWGLNDIRTDREAAHKIITEVKLDSGTKT